MKLKPFWFRESLGSDSDMNDFSSLRLWEAARKPWTQKSLAYLQIRLAQTP